MTHDTDDDEQRRADVSEADVTAVPPDGTQWELEIQVPFDKNERHDLTSAIVVAVAESEGVSPKEVKEPPLYEVLDVEAVEAALFGSETIGRSSEGYRSVEFMYRGHRIVVRSDAWVQVYDAIDSSDAREVSTN